MNKSILFLTILGIALAILHSPHGVLTLGIISCLVIAAIKLFWSVLQAFAQPRQRSKLT
ncbi:MAG: hypothetical protein HC800_06085 [Phormidesmis sp. RL_2_1]|nr:hypothetical protein [Phormidesmis sp. RL_2_1]